MNDDISGDARAARAIDLTQKALSSYGRVRASSELVGDLAHDLNNVLGALVLRAAILQADRACTASQGENIEAIVRKLKDAAARVSRMQELVRLRSDVRPEALDLAAILGDALDIDQTEAAKSPPSSAAKVALDVSLPSPFALTCSVGGASLADLRDVFVDLILNAREAMPNGGTIEIRGKSRPGAAIVTIADEGCGIPEAKLASVFDPLFTTKGDARAGLGLSNARDVMSAFGGQITAANRQGGGAIFTLTFPDVGESVLPRRSGAVKISLSPRVLVIDKNLEHQVMTKVAVELEGREVDAASSAREALAKVREGARYDLVLCDIGDEHLSDAEVFGAIIASTPETKIYVMAVGAEELSDDDSRRAFVSGVLSKPIRRDVFRSLQSGAKARRLTG